MSSDEVNQSPTEGDDLTELLDSALNDFGKTKTSDDDLDDFMSSLDRDAAQKAAANFHEMLEKMAKTTVAENKENQEINEKLDVGPLSGEGDYEANFLEQINKYFFCYLVNILFTFICFISKQ